MDFIATLHRSRVILTEGAVIERLRRETTITLDPHVLHAAWIRLAAGRQALARLYEQYIDVGRRYDLPLILGAPTWRASAERIQRAGIEAGIGLNAEAVMFVKALRGRTGQYGRRIFVAGMMACRNDAYKPQHALDVAAARRFHAAQAEALAAAMPDLILAATLPAASEAEGLARALADVACPYLISFVIRPDGNLLDGTRLDAAMGRIDQRIDPPPAAYMVNCVHPDHLDAALAGMPAAAPPTGRLLGLQANASRLSPEALDGRAVLDASAPAEFAAAMVRLQRRYRLKIFGGCCGTDQRHLQAMAAALDRPGGGAPQDVLHRPERSVV